jgi:hypothetical protein
MARDPENNTQAFTGIKCPKRLLMENKSERIWKKSIVA